MALSAIETVKELISYAVVTDKNGLVKLLQRNGIELPNNPSDNEVTVAVLMANNKSGVFRNELKKYLGGLVPEVANYVTELGGGMNFTGTDDFSFTAGDDSFYNATAAEKKSLRVTATNPTGKTKVGTALASIGSFFKDTLLTKENINTGINIGLTSLANKTQSQQNAVTAQSLQLQNYQDSLRQQLPNAAKKSNTMLYVWISVGVLAVGVLGFVLYKSYKKK
ncbi:hypothetical protein CCP3SC1AL1_420012 [Gammaproteobacteria bacterium]